MATNDDAIYYASLGSALSLILAVTGAAAGTIGATSGPSATVADVKPSTSQADTQDDPGAYLIAGDGNVALKENLGRNAVIGTMMSGVLGVYGVIVAVLIAGRTQDQLSLSDGYRFFAAGLTNGAASLVSGIGLGLVSRKAKTTNFVRFTSYRICIEALGLYGLITSLVMCGKE